jgi:hypothetical protein
MKKDYPKIEIHRYFPDVYKWKYVCTTTWSKTLKEAKHRYHLSLFPHDVHPQYIKAKFQRR